ncbi:hypothetical protein KC573_03165 [candidate division WWE3 bacterium]|uniref:KOW domain-containing protein n=1 Tax=candidate division WWE3 bacterium TaxID=2053526 RepID=A0A955LWG7_UNCKA|nr:hypothetical protein [candidate division WWE3 bacterium]
MFLGYTKDSYYRYTTHTINRSLPPNAQILVKVGDVVRPEKIVGIGRKSAGFRNIDAAKVLGVPSNELSQYVTKTPGSYVNKGEVLGEKKSLLGIKNKPLISPADGILSDINTDNGVISLEYMPEELRVVAGVSGTVTEIDPNGPEITIKTDVLEVKGALGLGKRREGSIHIVGQPDLPLSEKQIGPTWENKIIVGGSLLTRQVLYHCVALKVQGIITGGMHWEEYASLIGSRGRFEDIGISIILTEGYGNLPMSPKLFQKLQEYEGKFSFIWGGSARLMLPDQKAKERTEFTTEEISKYVVLEEGMKVRLMTLDHHGEFGTIKKLDEQVHLENGVITDVATIELYNGETKVVPATSFEVIMDD